MKIKFSTNIKYQRYDPILFKNPAMQLAGSIKSTYLENVAVASLIHIFQPNNFLDLGCYCGALPIMVEDLLSLSASDRSNKTEWYLVDDFSLLKSVAEFNQAFDKDNYAIHAAVYNYCLHLRNASSRGVLRNFPIPVDGEKLKTVLEGIVKMFGAPWPNINSISMSLADLQGVKFDMISFDLFADRYKENLKVLELVVKDHLNEKGLIVRSSWSVAIVFGCYKNLKFKSYCSGRKTSSVDQCWHSGKKCYR
jgi:hypothetical protein